MHTPCLSQMDHWRLDEDESGWEDDRQEKQRMQQAEAARLHAESAEFYQLARATREHKVTAPMPPPKAAPLGAVADKLGADKRKRPAAGLPAFKVHKKEATAATVPLAAAAGRAPAAPVDEHPAAGGGLPGMGAYGDSGDDSD
jgi:hypothetical protein